MNQNIDWPGIRANAVTMGIRAAARQAAINLPPQEQDRFVKRVLKRAEREGWHKAKQTAITLATPQGLPLSSPVVNGAEAALAKLKQHGDNTKQNLAEVAEKASVALLRKRGNALLKQHKAFRDFVSGSGQLHDWGTASQGGSVSVNILTNQAAVQVTQEQE